MLSTLLTNIHTSSRPISGGDDGLLLLLHKLPSLQAGYILHSRWFSNSTDYASQNGGKFNFTVEHDSQAFPGNGWFTSCRRTHACTHAHASHVMRCCRRVLAACRP